MFRLVVQSVNGARYMVGRTVVLPDGPVPSGEGDGFRTVQNARGYVRRELNGISSYYRAEVIDADGVTVAMGVRTGYNGSGRSFKWSNVEPVRDSSGQKILWREAFEIGGHTYTGEVVHHHYAGHGRVKGRVRWAVRFENEHRPSMAGDVVASVDAAHRAMARWADEFRTRARNGA